ncbi:MAG: hypothetical protein QM820_06970 [Minicystis sp.]
MKKTLVLLSSSLALWGCAAGSDTNTTGTSTYTNYTTGSGGSAGTGGSGGATGCVPNHDQKIDASELQPVFDVAASYFVSSGTVPVNLAGTDEGGTLVWDFSQSYPGGAKTLSASPITGKWFEPQFPGGQWVSPFDDETLAVYSNDDQGIYLHGLASVEAPPAGGDAKTLFVYDTKVTVYQFPLTKGMTWVSIGTVPAKGYRWNGLLHSGSHTYKVTDDGVGTLKLPSSTTLTDVHRIRTQVLVHPNSGADVTTRQTGFVYECLGEVVRATGAVDEPNEDFNPAAQVRRLVF